MLTCRDSRLDARAVIRLVHRRALLRLLPACTLCLLRTPALPPLLPRLHHRRVRNFRKKSAGRRGPLPIRLRARSGCLQRRVRHRFQCNLFGRMVGPRTPSLLYLGMPLPQVCTYPAYGPAHQLTSSEPRDLPSELALGRRRGRRRNRSTLSCRLRSPRPQLGDVRTGRCLCSLVRRKGFSYRSFCKCSSDSQPLSLCPRSCLRIRFRSCLFTSPSLLRLSCGFCVRVGCGLGLCFSLPPCSLGVRRCFCLGCSSLSLCLQLSGRLGLGFRPEPLRLCGRLRLPFRFSPGLLRLSGRLPPQLPLPLSAWPPPPQRPPSPQPPLPLSAWPPPPRRPPSPQLPPPLSA